MVSFFKKTNKKKPKPKPLSVNRVLKCFMVHSGLFITCVLLHVIFCMRQILVKIVISVWVFSQFRMKFLCDFQEHNI